MNTETTTVHPMVMKAARALARVDGCANWEEFSQVYIDQAQAALTACGALERLSVLEKAVIEFGCGFPACEAFESIEGEPPVIDEARSAIAKVYRSASHD